MEQIHTNNPTHPENTKAGNSHFNSNENNGRIGRRLYFIFAILLPFISFGMLNKIYTQLSHTDIVTGLFTNWILALITLSIFAMIVRLSVHRCYDFGANRWFALLSVIPFLPLILVLIPGNSDKNHYGEKPRTPALIIKDSFFLSLIKLNNRLKY